MELFDIKKIFKPLGNNPLLLKIQNVFFLQGAYLHAPLSFHLAVHPSRKFRKYDKPWARPFGTPRNLLLSGMEMTMTGIQAMQWAKEISKLPNGCFTIAFFPCSRHRGEAIPNLTVKEGCKWRTQLPEERFSIDSDNFFLFSDADGEPKMCYRILIRYMGFPQDGFKLHKIDWL